MLPAKVEPRAGLRVGSSLSRPAAGFLVAAGLVVVGLCISLVALLDSGDDSSGRVEAARVSDELALAGNAATPLSPKSAPADTALPPIPGPPLVRQAAPAEALPATSARGFEGRLASISDGPRVAAAPTVAGPYSVAIVNETGNASDLAVRVRSELVKAGIDVQLAGTDEIGPADAVIVFLPGDSLQKGAWYCEGLPGAGNLAASVTPGLRAPPSLSPQSQEPPALDCRSLTSRWPRTPMAILGLSVETDRDSATSAGAVAGGVASYFSRFGPEARNFRSQAKLAWPALGPITSFFGPAHPLGIDIGQQKGPILAATDGTVTFAGGDPCCSYGRYVVIDSSAGIRTLHAHLSSISVKQGARLKQGQPLGVVGSTGNSSGPHLHFEVIDNGFRQDPLSYLPR